MNQPYLAFLLLLGFVAFNAALLIGLSHLLAPHKPTAIKDSPYESGMPPLGNARELFRGGGGGWAEHGVPARRDAGVHVHSGGRVCVRLEARGARVGLNREG